MSHIKQATWFVIVGTSAALVHFCVLFSCVQWGGLSPAWANGVAFFVAFCVSFSGHFFLTFYSDEVKKSAFWKRSLVKWFASSVSGFFANQALFVLGLSWFGEQWYLLIWFVVTGIITFLTFALGKWWAFAR
ncbi:MAG: GtrA family protein [Gammaproteobacteria bacterium]|nr:GtrA family protein [Gammaproteobacteria bacterium]